MSLGDWQKRVERLLVRAGWEMAGRLQRPPALELVHAREARDHRGGEEIVRRCAEPSYIEPDLGYVITAAGVLIEESLAPNSEYPKATWRIGLPSRSGFLAARRGQRPMIRVPAVISLRHFWEWNYYHFYLDVLGKLQLFDEIGLDPAIPLAVGRYVTELPFAEQALRAGQLQDRNWLVQDGAYIQADEIYYCRVKTPHGERVRSVVELLGAGGGDPAPQDRIFLTRAPGSSRRLENADAVEAVLREYRFETVDTAKLNLQEQAAIFGRARYLVALHGAGMVNLIFRCGAPMSVLELRGDTYGSTDYEELCRDLGFEWDHLSGQPAPGVDRQLADFTIDPERLREKLDCMMLGVGPA